jgi:hypothetical protein
LRPYSRGVPTSYILMAAILGNVAGWVGLAAGQAAELTQLKAASNLTPEQVQTIQQWVQQHVAGLLTAEDADKLRQAIKPFLDAYAGATEVFQTRFAQTCAEACASHLMDPGIRPEAALLMAQMLAVQAHAGSIPTLTQVLGSPHVTTRFWAAKGLTALRREVSASPQAAEVIAALRQAGSAEPSDLVLREMFSALNLREVSANTSLAQQVGQALAAIFQAQIAQHSGGVVGMSSAYVVGLRVLGAVIADVDDATRRQAVQAVAQILYHAVRQFDPQKLPSPTDRDAALLVEQAETLLRQVARAAGQTGATPDVLERLKAGNLAEAQAELRKWIGSPQEEGVLNRLFALPRGAGLPTLTTAPATSTQAAAQPG